jgi:hypothetical protein
MVCPQIVHCWKTQSEDITWISYLLRERTHCSGRTLLRGHRHNWGRTRTFPSCLPAGSGDAGGRKSTLGAVGPIHVHAEHHSSWTVDGRSPVTPLLADAGACVCLHCIPGTLVHRRKPDAYLGGGREGGRERQRERGQFCSVILIFLHDKHTHTHT